MMVVRSRIITHTLNQKLRHRYKPEDVCGKHAFNVSVRYISNLLNTEHIASIVDYTIR